MPEFLQPDPVLLTFFALRRLAVLPILACLALARTIGGRGSARILGALAFGLALAGLAAEWLPPLLGLHSGPVAGALSVWRNWGSGFAALALPAAALLASGLPQTARWRWIDWLAWALVIGFIAFAVVIRIR